jgi:hypothetical protein
MMTAAPRDTLGQDLRAWAADELQVEPTASPEAVRAAYYRQVQRDNGAVNLPAREALLILISRNGAARPTLALEDVEDDLLGELDEFAGRFFSLPVAERTARWQNLMARGQWFVRAGARLDALRAGLDVVVPEFGGDSPLGPLAALVCELFVLRPQDRAARRDQFAAEMEECQGDRWQKENWSSAALTLRNDHPAIANLDPLLISHFTGEWQDEKRKVARRLRVRKFVGRLSLAWSAVKWCGSLLWALTLLLGACLWFALVVCGVVVGVALVVVVAVAAIAVILCIAVPFFVVFGIVYGLLWLLVKVCDGVLFVLGEEPKDSTTKRPVDKRPLW